MPLPPPLIVQPVAQADGLLLSAEAGTLVVSAPRADGTAAALARVPFAWTVRGVAAHAGRALVTGGSGDRGWVAVIDLHDAAHPVVITEAHADGAVGAAWLSADDAWIQLTGAGTWEDRAGTLVAPGVGDLLVHVELADPATRSAGRIGDLDVELLPAADGAWLRTRTGPTRVARLSLPDTGPAVRVAAGPAEAPRTGASVGRAVGVGGDLLLAWESEGRVELSVVAADGFGGVWTREYLPGGDGRLVGLDVVGDTVMLSARSDDQVRRTTLTRGADGHLTRQARTFDAADTPVLLAAPIVEVAPVAPAPIPEITMAPVRVAPEPVRVGPMPTGGLVLGDVPDLRCTASLRPPPSEAPLLGARVVVEDGAAWAIQPDTRTLWRVDGDHARRLDLIADGLWVGHHRVVVLLDGGRRLGLLDERGENVARSVPIPGNVRAVVPTDAAIWVATETGDGSCGTELLRVPYDDGVVGVTDLAGAPGPMSAWGDGVVAAIWEPETERTVAVGVTSDGGRTVAHLDGHVVALRADRDGATVMWSRGGLGFGRLSAHAGAWTEARSARIETPDQVRDGWIDADIALVRLGGAAGDRVCRVDAAGLGACVDAPVDAAVWTARLDAQLLVGSGPTGLVGVDGADRLGAARTDHAALNLAACREGGSRRACKKALRAAPGETILALGQDGDVVATVSTVGIVLRDTRRGHITARRAWTE